MEMNSDLEAPWHFADLNKDGDIDWDDFPDIASKYRPLSPLRADGDLDEDRDVPSNGSH